MDGPEHREEPAELNGPWRAALSHEETRRALADPELDDSGWAQVTVPGHWRSCADFAASDGPLAYRRRFSLGRPGPGTRSFLVFDGIFYQGDVWLDGEYVGDTEGYFFPHYFEVTDALARCEDHLLAVEVSCSRPSDPTAKRNLTGVFQHWDCIDPDWNPGGIWAGVRVEHTGPIRIASLKVLCREAVEERAVLDFEAVLDAPDRVQARLTTTVRRLPGEGPSGLLGDPPGAAPPSGGEATHEQAQTLSGGANRVRWRVAVERPALWWPWSLGDQPLYEVTVEVRSEEDSGPASDRRSLVTGLRHVKMRDFTATVNGERIFLKGANVGPTRRALAEATPEEFERDVSLAVGAGLDLVRVQAHITSQEFYAAADRQGLLIWQDLPLAGGYGNVRRQAVAQARRAVELLGHHPSVAVWCGHDEPLTVDAPRGGRRGARSAVASLLPSWNRTGLDRSIRRALEHADGSRTVVAHSGVLPHPAWGTDSHLYYGWARGQLREFAEVLARFPVLGRFVGEFGAQAVPNPASWMHPAKWPDLDWDTLESHHGYQRSIFEDRVPPAYYPTFDTWADATQEYQSEVLRFHIETLRRLKYRPTGGFCFFLLADAQPAISWSVLDHERVPKAAYGMIAQACAPVIVVADWPDLFYRPGQKLEFDLHVVSDLRAPITGAKAEAVVSWPGGSLRRRFEGDVRADHCSRIGRVAMAVPREAASGQLTVELSLCWDGGEAANRYSTVIVA